VGVDMNNKKIYFISLVILSGIIMFMGLRIYSLEVNIKTLMKNSEERNRNLIFKLEDLERTMIRLGEQQISINPKDASRDKKL